MAGHEAKQTKQSDDKKHQKTEQSTEEFIPIDSASPVGAMQTHLGNPSAKRHIAPATVMMLQRTVGNAFVQRFLNRARALVQRAVLPGPSVSHTPAEINDMTLSEFHQFAQDQVDWFNTPGISNQQRWKFRGLLTFATRTGVLSGCGGMKVSDLLATGLVSAGGDVSATIAGPLEDYGKAVSQDVDTVEIQTPTNDPTLALRWGRALHRLMNAPGLGGAVLKHGMHQVRFEELVTRNFVDDFITYMRTCTPRIEAEKTDGANPVDTDDIASYIALRNEGRDPIHYNGTLLRGNVDNFHRFHREALDKLVQNFGKRNEPNARRQPLTLILHTARDHNAAFHRDPNLRDVIINPRINVLMLEGKETLADVSSELQPLARAYGKDRQIDQVMFAGHGNNRSIELGASEDVDLDANAAASNALFDELLRNMANDPAVAPHRRIVFNACLTNSNAVPIPVNAGTPATAQREVRDHISANSSLATYLQQRARAQGLANIDVLGANGSFGQVQLIDAADGLNIVASYDPSLTAEKLEYVRTGTDPEGVLRAVLECWSGLNAPDPAARRLETLTAMETRVRSAPSTFKTAIIHTMYDIILARYRDNGEMIRLFGDVAYAVSELRGEGEECRVSNLTSAGLGPAGSVAAEAANLFTGILPHMGSLNSAKLVVYQVWMRHDNAKRTDFMTALTTFNCQTAADFLDVGFVTPELPNLLPINPTPTREQLLLAFRVIDTNDAEPTARAFLLNAVGAGNRRFPAALNVDDILRGRPDQVIILQKLGLVPGGGGPPAATDQHANLDLDGDGTNETYVEPLPGVRGETTTRAVRTFDHPDTTSTRMRDLWMGQRLYIVGQTGDFYAIHNPWVARQVIFVEKVNVREN